MGEPTSKSVIEPTWGCCEHVAWYVFTGCKIECGCGRCWTCKLEDGTHNTGAVMTDAHQSQHRYSYLITFLIYTNNHVDLIYTLYAASSTFNVFSVLSIQYDSKQH